MWILGLNAPPLGWHETSACLTDEKGTVHALVEEERISRIKHGVHVYPKKAVRTCLDIAGIRPEDIDVIALGWDLPRQAARTDLDRLDPPLPGRPWQFGDTRSFVTECLSHDFGRWKYPDVVFVPHHVAHALCAFYSSGMREAGVVVVDGNGDEESVSVYSAVHGRPLKRHCRWPLPFSIGYMYDAVSRAIGLYFLEAGKTMGLAAYGRAREMTPWPIFGVTGSGYEPPFSLPEHAGHGEVIKAWHEHFANIGFKAARTSPEMLDKDNAAVRLAWSAQHSLQEVMQWLATTAREVTGKSNLCLSGGVGLNCSSNGLLPGPVYVPPVTSDAGASLGAAWSVAPPPLTGDPISPFLGSPLNDHGINDLLEDYGYVTTPDTPATIAARLLDGEIGAIVTGRSEVGPRALCHRSILAYPDSVSTRDRVNLAKGRESWRPLGPVGLPECEDAYWEPNSILHKYMLGASMVSPAGQRSLPGIVHIDGTARPQVISPENIVMTEILSQQKTMGAAPALINTSFNGKGEPLVNTAEEAMRTGRSTGLNFLILDERVVVPRR